MEDLVRRLLAGEAAALARACTIVETGGAPAALLLDRTHRQAGERLRRAHRIGVTGSPGAGKSTLVAGLVADARRAGGAGRVGVVAVDPSSPFTHGALLGDRVRLPRELALDESVFFRSLATRGALGGLAAAAADVADLLAAWGADLVLVETVGVGQSEIDVASSTDTVLLVLQPSTGDEVQALKAGVLEVADIVCVHKADLPGADELAMQVRGALALSSRASAAHPGFETPVVLASSTAPLAGGAGGRDALAAALTAHRLWLDGGAPRSRREERRERQLAERIERLAASELAASLRTRPALQLLDVLAGRAARGEISPQQAVRDLLAGLSQGG